MGLPCATLFIPCGSPRMQVLFLVLHVATKAGDAGEVKALAQTVNLGLNPVGPQVLKALGRGTPWGAEFQTVYANGAGRKKKRRRNIYGELQSHSHSTRYQEYKFSHRY